MNAGEPSARPDGRQSRWEQHKLDRRALILDAAIAVLQESAPGEEIHVQAIAQRAGLVRSVVYRHFEDRADLDRAVQARVLGLLRDELAPVVTLSGSIEQIIRRIIETYVGWAAEHPALHHIAMFEPAGQHGPGELEIAVLAIAEQVAGLFTLGAELVGVRLDEEDQAALDPLIFGLVGQAVGATRHWLSRPILAPSADVLSRLLGQTIWFQIDGHARARGVVLDPKVPLEVLIGAALDEALATDH